MLVIKDRWYIACPSGRLVSDKPYAFNVGGESLVAFRDEDGNACVLTDRCPHRAVPLSLGRVADGRISCGYHGWTFNAQGELVEIPAERRPGPAPYCVKRHVATEAFHYVWVWVPGKSESPTYEPHLRGFSEDRPWHQFTGVWNTQALFGVENNMDATHTPFAHAGNYPGREGEQGKVPELRAATLRCYADDETVVVWGPALTNGAVPSFEGDCNWGMLFELPFTNYVNLPFGDTQAIYHWIPISEDKCRLEFMLSSVSSVSPPHGGGRSVRLLDEEIEILAQDRILLEGAQARISEADGDFQGVSVESDLGQLAVRRLIRKALRSEDGRTGETPSERDFKAWM